MIAHLLHATMTHLEHGAPARVVRHEHVGLLEEVLSPDQPAVDLGFGRVVALYDRSPTSYRNREHIRYLYF